MLTGKHYTCFSVKSKRSKYLSNSYILEARHITCSLEPTSNVRVISEHEREREREKERERERENERENERERERMIERERERGEEYE